MGVGVVVGVGVAGCNPDPIPAGLPGSLAEHLLVRRDLKLVDLRSMRTRGG